MRTLKLKLTLIIALALVFFVTVGAVLGINLASAERYVTISGSTVFYTSGSAQVWAHRVEREPVEEEEEDPADYYTMFVFQENDDEVSYRRNLAYKWFYDSTDEDDYLNDDKDSDETEENEDKKEEEEEEVIAEPVKETGYFYLEMGFEEVNFKKFTIVFESQQYNQTKDDKTTNYVIFLPADGGKVYVVITDDKEVAEKEDLEPEDNALALAPDRIAIALSGGEKGEYGVEIYNVGESEKVEGTFKNIGLTFARYVSSSTNPVTPLTFKAEFPEAEEGKEVETGRVRMALYELNRQSFKLEDTSTRPINTIYDENGEPDYYTGGQINDTTPPVLCLNKGLTFIEQGSEITFSTTVIDVLTQSPSTETGYFMLTEKQAEQDDFNANNYNDKKLFQEVKDSDDQYMIPHREHYLPEVSGIYSEKYFNPVAAVKVYVKLTDTASTGGQSTYVMLDWYVEDEYLLKIGPEGNKNSYIAVASDKQGATYNYDGIDNADGEHQTWEEIKAEYQAAVIEAAEDLEAGSQNYIYLPDASKLFSDNATAYEDMTYSIYFNNGSQQSDTNNASNNLSINLSRATTYTFTIYAHDGKNNNMWYTNDDGEVETFSTSDIWKMYPNNDEDDLSKYLPWFEFEVGSSEISVEDPEDQDTAYVGSEYTASSFDINGVAYDANYSLYLFDSDGYYADHGERLTYDGFMELIASFKEDGQFNEYRMYFTLIRDVSELDETDEDYETQSAYGWNSGSRVFTPQEANAFYLIKCEVKSTEDARPAVKAYMGIASSVRPRPIAGEDTWVQDNMISIILLSIAGASLIGIILLLVIRPRNKGDIDEQFEVETTRKAVKNRE